MSSRGTGVVSLALGVKLLAKEGWDGVDIVVEAGSSAVSAGTIDDESVRVAVILDVIRAELGARSLLSATPLALHGE